MRKHPSYRVVALAPFLLAVCGPAGDRPSNESGRALWQRFESVFYTDGRLLNTPASLPGVPERVARLLRMPYAHLLAAISSLKAGASGEVLRRTLGVTVGASDFHAPEGLGSVGARFCYVLEMDGSKPANIEKFFDGKPSTGQNGERWWSWSADIRALGENERRVSTLFLGEAKNRYLVLSNDLRDLHALLASLRMVDRRRADTSEISLWEFVEGRPVWGSRRYRHGQVQDRTAAGLTDIGPDAQALGFRLEPNSQSAVLRLLASPTGDTAKRVGQQMFDFQSSRPGVWDARISLEDERAYERLFSVMGLFGFGLFL